MPVGEFVKSVPDVLYATGMPLHDVEAYLAKSTYRGFPVVQSESNYNLLGYIERHHLQYAISKAYAQGTLHSDTTCLFQPKSTEAYALTTAQIQSDPAVGTNLAPAVHLSEEEMEIEVGPLQLGDWVDPAPLIVQPQLDLEVVADMFKRLGPRVILVCQNGQLIGIVTVKDLLRHIAMNERVEADGHNMSSANDTRGDTDFAVGTGELEQLLETSWTWLCSCMSRMPWVRRYVQASEFVPLTTVTTLYENE